MTKAELEAENRELKAYLDDLLETIKDSNRVMDKAMQTNRTLKRSFRKTLLDLFRHEDVREEFFSNKEIYAHYLAEDLLDNKPNPTDPYPLDEWNKMWE